MPSNMGIGNVPARRCRLTVRVDVLSTTASSVSKRTSPKSSSRLGVSVRRDGRYRPSATGGSRGGVAGMNRYTSPPSGISRPAGIPCRSTQSAHRSATRPSPRRVPESRPARSPVTGRRVSPTSPAYPCSAAVRSRSGMVTDVILGPFTSAKSVKSVILYCVLFLSYQAKSDYFQKAYV